MTGGKYRAAVAVTAGAPFEIVEKEIPTPKVSIVAGVKVWLEAILPSGGVATLCIP